MILLIIYFYVNFESQNYISFSVLSIYIKIVTYAEKKHFSVLLSLR